LQETEVQLVQSEKMNAVGRLSGGILHEINNPLNAALMALHLARQKNPTDSVAEYLSELETALKRIRTVTTDLRSFAHPNHDVADERFTIESALSAAERMLAHDLGDLSIRRENIGDSLVRGSKNQITHVFINLLSNAAMAVRAAGERTPAVVVRTRVDQNRLVTTVQDNGVGIPEINLTRVTEPFFTTRDVGQGMGLGLSICHTIIRNHGGTLRIESSEGQWTCVSFDLSLDVPEMTA
jgi:two-component system sensor histidine kinase PhcS